MFVIPRVKTRAAESHVRLVSAAHVPIRVAAARKALRRFLKAHEVRTIDSLLRPYLNAPEYRAVLRRALREGAEPAPPAHATGIENFTPQEKADLAASFQAAVVDVLRTKLRRAAKLSASYSRAC